MANEQEPTMQKMFAGLYVETLANDLLDANGNVVAPAGTKIIITPMTTARAVMVGEDSLEDLWSSLSKTNHTHSSATSTTAGFMSAADKENFDEWGNLLATFQQQLVTYMDRVYQLELWAISNGYSGYTAN